MSYYSGYSSYSSGLTSSYGSSSSYTPSYDYSRSSYEPYSLRSNYSSSSYKPKTYDFGTSSFLSKSYGSSDYSSPYSRKTSDYTSSYARKSSDYTSSYARKSSDYTSYSRKYDDYSWKAKDLLTDNPHNKEVDVQLRETTKEKREFTSINESEDKEELAIAEDEKNEDSSSKDSSKDYSRKDYSRDIYSKEDNTQEDSRDLLKGYSKRDYSKEDNSRENSSDLLNGYSRKHYSQDIYSKEDNTREDSNDLLKGYTRKDNSRDYSSKKQEHDDLNGDHVIRGSKKNYLNDYQNKTDDTKSKVDSNGLDINMNYSNYNKGGTMDEVDSTLKNLSLRDGNATEKEKTSHHKKKVFNFEEDDDVFIKPENESSLQSGRETLFNDVKRPISPKTHENFNSSQRRNETATDRYSSYKPRDTGLAEKDPGLTNQKLENHRVEKPKSKSASDVTDSGPLRMHRQGVAKFISAIPDQKRYVSSVNFLPDRIELRFTGAPPREKKMKRCRSITDLYEITVEPEQEDQVQRRRHPWEDTIQYQKQDLSYSYDSENEILHYAKNRHQHMKEDTIQCQKQDLSYSYDSENEILHYTKHRHEHTKEMYISQYTHHFDPEEPRSHIAGWKCDVEPNGIPHERSRMCVLKSPVVSGSRRHVPRPKSAPPQLFTRPVSPAETIRSQKVDVYERGYNTLPRSKGRQEDFFFCNSVDESMTEAEVSSLGYAPSDDTSDSSAFFFNDPRFLSRYQNENQDKERKLSFSKPKLIRLSAEFPGIRNLEKMRRKRQSMGSYSSGGSRSSVGHSPSPRNGEYGFFVALTSGDPRKPQPIRRRQQRHSHYY